MIKKFLVLLIFIFVGFVPARSVLANSNFERLSSETTIDADYIRAAQNIVIDGTINGDAYLAGGIVTVNGNVTGDLFVAGGKVTISGQVGGSIRAVGADVTISSSVGRNVSVVAGNASLGKGSSIGGSLLATGSNLEVYTAEIGRGFRFFGNRLYLNSAINREAFVVADREFILGPNASISGVLKYSGANQVILEPGATVAGTIAFQKQTTNENFPRFFGASKVIETFRTLQPLTDSISFFVSLLVGFVLLGLFPKSFEKAVRAIETRPYASFGWGIITILLLPFVAVLFAITLVGLPVTIALLIMFSLLLFASKLLVAFFLGRRILLARFGERRGWALFLGLLLMAILSYVPYLGVFIKVVLYLFAIGAIILGYRQPAIYLPKPITEYANKSPAKVKRKSTSRSLRS